MKSTIFYPRNSMRADIARPLPSPSVLFLNGGIVTIDVIGF